MAKLSCPSYVADEPFTPQHTIINPATCRLGPISRPAAGVQGSELPLGPPAAAGCSTEPRGRLLPSSRALRVPPLRPPSSGPAARTKLPRSVHLSDQLLPPPPQLPLPQRAPGSHGDRGQARGRGLGPHSSSPPSDTVCHRILHNYMIARRI